MGAATTSPSAAGAVALPLVVCQFAEPCGIGVDTAIIGAALITAGVYATKLAYTHFSNEQSQIREAARQAGITYQQFSDYLHMIKGGPAGGGRGPRDNYTFAQLVLLAKEAAQYYASH
jgi:hypothetical protein